MLWLNACIKVRHCCMIIVRNCHCIDAWIIIGNPSAFTLWRIACFANQPRTTSFPSLSLSSRRMENRVHKSLFPRTDRLGFYIYLQSVCGYFLFLGKDRSWGGYVLGFRQSGGDDAEEWNPNRFLDGRDTKQTSLGVYANLYDLVRFVNLPC